MSKKRTHEEDNENLITTAIENAGAALENAASSSATEYIQKNVEYRASAGLKETIIREELSSCCKWCHDLAGTYEYGKEPSNVYARHDNCKCIVLFKSAKGKYQDVWSKREHETHKEAILERINEIKEKPINRVLTSKDSHRRIINNTKEFVKNANSGSGEVTFEEGFNEKDKLSEKKCAEYLNRQFGGDITCLVEVNEDGINTPDFLWNGKLWELKEPTTIHALDQRLKKGLNQISKNQGGIIIDIHDANMDVYEIEKTIVNRIERKDHINKKYNLEIMIKRNNKLIEVLKIEK